MAFENTCPWCKMHNKSLTPLPPSCANCYHRIDVPKDQCDCLQCHPPPWVPGLADVAQLAAEVHELRLDLPEVPNNTMYTTSVTIKSNGDRLGTAVITCGEVGACLVAGDHGNPEVKVTVEWERAQLVHIVCAMLPYLTDAEKIRVVSECDVY